MRALSSCWPTKASIVCAPKAVWGTVCGAVWAAVWAIGFLSLAVQPRIFRKPPAIIIAAEASTGETGAAEGNVQRRAGVSLVRYSERHSASRAQHRCGSIPNPDFHPRRKPDDPRL